MKKILKWVFFGLFIALTLISFTVVFLMYSKLSFIDYPYLYFGIFTSICSILIFKFKVS